jgi:hypothetical protein
MTEKYPIYPSAKIAVPSHLYIAAAKLLIEAKISHTFFDGEFIIVPESDANTIGMLLTRFEGQVGEMGWGSEYRYATLASAVGVSGELISLGNAIYDPEGQRAEEMVDFALSYPNEAQKAWSDIYRDAMLNCI